MFKTTVPGVPVPVDGRVTAVDGNQTTQPNKANGQLKRVIVEKCGSWFPINPGKLGLKIDRYRGMGEFSLIKPAGAFCLALGRAKRLVKFGIPVKGSIVLPVAPRITEVTVGFRRH